MALLPRGVGTRQAGPTQLGALAHFAGGRGDGDGITDKSSFLRPTKQSVTLRGADPSRKERAELLRADRAKGTAAIDERARLK